MATVAIEQDLRTFAVELFEHSGGVADWPSPDVPGTAVIPPDVSKAAQLPGEEFALSTVAGLGQLQVSLASDFLDIAGRVLDVAVPRDGSFGIAERYLTSRDLADKAAHTFTWQNARAKYSAAEPVPVEYHLWTLLGSLRSEDVWESLFRVNINAESQAIVDLPDVFQEPDLRGEESPAATTDPSTYAVAIMESKRLLVTASAEYVRRIEQRLDRDRKRLQDYYRALSREAKGSKRRAGAELSHEEVEAKKKAVDLELRRKLAELNENYALRAVIHPVVLARVHLPALAVPVTIQRKQAIREYRLYWNSFTKKFEPVSCSRCRRPTFSATVTNETVDLLCGACVG